MHLFFPNYRVTDVLKVARSIQKLGSLGVDYAVSKLMRLAVVEEGEGVRTIVLCRLLFRSPSGGAMRRPGLGAPGFLGGSSSPEDWPFEPVHLHRGVPFYVVRGYNLAGLPESGSAYLSCCLREGTWNSDPIPEYDDDTLREVAEDFIANGPWEDALDEDSQAFIRSQVP